MLCINDHEATVINSLSVAAPRFLQSAATAFSNAPEPIFPDLVCLFHSIAMPEGVPEGKPENVLQGMLELDAVRSRFSPGKDARRSARNIDGRGRSTGGKTRDR